MVIHHSDKGKRSSFSGINVTSIRVYVKVNGEIGIESHGKALVVEREWTFEEFLSFASRKIDMMNATRAFTSLGNLNLYVLFTSVLNLTFFHPWDNDHYLNLFSVYSLSLGGELMDIFMLEDESDVYLSTGGDFIVPLEDAEECSDKIPASVAMYNVGEQLGEGGFGVVMLGTNKTNPNEKVALKFLRKEAIKNVETAALLDMEIQCLSLMRHKHILRLHERLETAFHVVLSIDLMLGGDLFQHCKNRGTTAAECALPEDDARHIFKQILDGVNHMHHNRIVHRDLKLENILMCGTPSRVVKITDFGMAVHLRLTSTRLADRCGTLAYMPPEVVSDDGKSFAGPPLDYWALGNILFALLCGRLPFLGVPSLSTPVEEWPSISEVESNIISCRYEFEPHASEESHDVVQILLHKVGMSLDRLYQHLK